MKENDISFGKDFVCKRYKILTRNETSVERLNDHVVTVQGFCWFGNASNASGIVSAMTVVARIRIGCVVRLLLCDVIDKTSYMLRDLVGLQRYSFERACWLNLVRAYQ